MKIHLHSHYTARLRARLCPCLPCSGGVGDQQRRGAVHGAGHTAAGLGPYPRAHHRVAKGEGRRRPLPLPLPPGASCIGFLSLLLVLATLHLMRWTWLCFLQVAANGQPVFPLTSQHRKPYEFCIIGARAVESSPSPCPVAGGGAGALPPGVPLTVVASHPIRHSVGAAPEVARPQKGLCNSCPW